MFISTFYTSFWTVQEMLPVKRFRRFSTLLIYHSWTLFSHLLLSDISLPASQNNNRSFQNKRDEELVRTYHSLIPTDHNYVLNNKKLVNRVPS